MICKNYYVKHIERILLSVLLINISLIPAFPQAQKNSQQIKGKVVMIKDEKEQNISYANLSILELPDSTFITGTTTDDNGTFSLKFRNDTKKKYLIKASYIGCISSFINLDITSKKQTADIGTIVLEEDIKNLKEVVVTAIRQPVEQKKDTTIFNAEAYKVPDGAYLEALIRRIPGLSYDPKTKAIKYNGETIKEITVNGKEFFKGNNKVALENLPAKFVSRLKVYDKATEEEEATGVKGSEKNYVLDLQTKKNMNGTIMSSVEGGYGSKNKYYTNAQLYKFKENGDNVSIFGTYGNKNFNTAYRGNKIGNIGGNISKKINEKLQLSGYMNYYDSKTGNKSTTRNEQYMTDKNQYGISDNLSESKNNSLSSNFNLIWNIDKKTMFHVTGGGNWGKSNNMSDSRSAKFSENPGLDLIDPFEKYEETDKNTRIYESSQNNFNKADNSNFNISASLVRKLKKEGNSVGIIYTSTMSKYDTDAYRIFNSTFYMLKDIYGNDSVEYRHQYQSSPTRNYNNQINLNYTWQIKEKSHIQFSYSLNVQNEKQLQNTYDLTDFADKTTEKIPGTNNRFSLPEGYKNHFVDSLSNRRKSNTTSHSFSARYSYTGDVWNINGGVTVSPQRRSLNQYDNKISIDTVGYSVQWSPQLYIGYNKNDYDINIRYNGNTRQPMLSELMAPTIYYSATYISRSNPNLKASYSQNISLSFSNFKKGFSSYINYGHQFNDITQATLYNQETGGIETYPVNLNGNWNIMGNTSYERRLGQFKLAGQAGGNYNHSVGLMNENKDEELKKSITKSSGIYSRFEASYLPSWGNIDLNASWDYQKHKNSLNISDNTNTVMRNYSIGSVISATLPKYFQIDTDFIYNIRSGTNIDSKEENEILWNFKVTWKFLKERKAEISLLWADILNQKKSLFKNALYNGFYESYSEQLGSYFIISLRYNFNKMQ
ncbi:MAG: outer membrane beta-barrel protein [Phocaeicola sp.]|nr:outer membrane beta-barrel protein [Phocaeicola sp.]